MAEQVQPVEDSDAEIIVPLRRALPLQARTSGERGSKGGVPKELLASPRAALVYKFGAGMMSDRQKESYTKAATAYDKAQRALQEGDTDAYESNMALNSRVRLSKADYEILDNYLGQYGGGRRAARSIKDDAFMRGLKDFSEMGFSMLGGLAAAPGGGRMAAAGSQLGTGAGAGVFDVATNLVEGMTGPISGTREGDEALMARLMGGEAPPRGMNAMQVSKDMIAETVIDKLTAGLARGVPATYNWMKSRILKIPPEAREVVEAGTRLGEHFPGTEMEYTGGIFTKGKYSTTRVIAGVREYYKGVLPLPFQVSTSGLIRGWPVVLGRVPIIGRPIKPAVIEQHKKIAAIVNSLPGRVSPTTLSDPDLAIRIATRTEAARASLEKFGAQAESLAARQAVLVESGERLGNVIELSDTKKVVDGYMANWQFRTQVADQPVARTLQVVKELQKVTKRGKISLGEWRTTMDALQTEIENIDWKGGKGGPELRQVMEDMRNDMIGTPKIGARQLALDKAMEKHLMEQDTFLAKNMAGMSEEEFTKTVNQLQSKDPQGLVSTIMGSQDAGFVKRVRTIIGDDAMTDVATRYMDRLVKKSMHVPKGKTQQFFDPVKFETELGFNDKGSFRYAATLEMLRGTGVTPKALEDLIKVSKAMASVDIPDVSTFVARSVVLGGVKSGLGKLFAAGLIGGSAGAGGGTGAAVAGAAGWLGSVPAAIAMTLMLRKGSRIITNPAHLKLMTQAIDPNANKVVQRMAVVRMMTMLAREEAGLGPMDTGEMMSGRAAIGVQTPPMPPQEMPTQ